MSNKPCVFLSYAKEDLIYAEYLKEKLTLIDIDVWSFKNNLMAGHEWRNEIDKALAKSDIIVVIMTPNSFKSAYVTYEWSFGLGMGKQAICALFQETEIHPRLTVFQYLSFLDHPNVAFDKLAAVVNSEFKNNQDRAKSREDHLGEAVFKSQGFETILDNLDIKIIKNYIGSSQREICIMDNWICEDIDEIKDDIFDALNRDVVVKIVLLNPYCVTGRMIAKQRSRNLVDKKDNYAQDAIMLNLESLSTIKSENFYLRLSAGLPTLETYVFDDVCLTGNYLFKHLSSNSPHLVLNKSTLIKSEYLKSILKNFEAVFNDAIPYTKAVQDHLVEELHHVNIPVKNVEVSTRFYKDVLHLLEIHRPENIFSFGGAWFELPSGQHLHLVENQNGTFRKGRDKKLKKDGQAPDVHFAFKTSHQHLHEVVAYAQGNGHEVLEQPYPNVIFLQTYLVDPDGHIVEITADPKPKKISGTL